MEMNLLFMSLVFGCFGMAFFVYGKRQLRLPFLGAGMALMVLPYVIPNLIALCVLGAVLIVGPFLLPAA